MSAFSRSVGGRAYPPVTTVSGGALVREPYISGTYTAGGLRPYPQLVRLALPLRARTSQSYGTTGTPLTMLPGARVVRIDQGTLVRVFGA